MYRWSNGRLEQIGMGWGRHTFFALSQSECGPCQATDGTTLGIDCTDTSTASRNGSQGSLGPKYQVNATTGFFPYPPANPFYSGSTARRCRVLSEDVLPAENPNSLYFMECQFICPDDSPNDAGDASNNASHRQLNMDSSGAISSFAGPTLLGLPAIASWDDLDPEVNLHEINIPGEGTIWFGSRAFEEKNGLYRYEYAIYNLDVDRSIHALRIPASVFQTDISEPKHIAPEWHSGEQFSNQTWTYFESENELIWSCEPYSENEFANSVRFGTLHNISFVSSGLPNNTQVTLDFFKPGNPSFIEVEAVVPNWFCSGDCDNDGICDNVEIAEGSAIDQNGNNIDDNCDPDCDGDGVPDFQEIAAGSFDCDLNSIPDSCQIADDSSLDLNANTFIDECETDCNLNDVFDFIDVYTGSSLDINSNNIPDECEDCDGDGVPDDTDSDPDCNNNGTPDVCERFQDCDGNGVPDDCQEDCDGDGIPNACSDDCDQDGTPDNCQTFDDCNQNGIPDECDIAEGSASDLNQDNIPDSCQCIADVITNGTVDYSDLITVISNWGTCEPPCPSDIVADGIVGYEDLLQVLAAWGPCSG